MASSSAPSPPKPSNSDSDMEIEYEEIEVEEEVETEEEVDDEEGNGAQKDDDEIGFGEDLTPVREENDGNGERTSSDNDPKAPFDNSGKVNDANRTLFVGDVNASLPAADASKKKDNTIVSINTAVEDVKGKKQMPLRSHVPQIRLRESSFNSDFDGESKKLRIPCEYHAQGWCIKGNSCSFLHMNHGLAAGRKRESLDREASSGAYSPLRRGGEIALNSNLDNYSYSAAPLLTGSLIDRNRTYHGNFLGSSVAMHGSPRNTRKTDFERTLTEMINRKNDVFRNDLRSADLPYSHSRQPLSFGSSSWKDGALGTRNLLEIGQEHCASASSSLKWNTLPVYDFKSPPVTNEYKPMYENWDPTVFHCPPHPMSRDAIKDNLHDSIRDGIGQNDVKDGRLKFSSSDLGSVKNVHLQSNNSHEANLLNSVYVGDTMKDKILSSSDDNKLKFEKPQPQMEVKGDGSSGKKTESNVDFKRDGQLQIESRALKYFEAELIEFIKELVKPTWRKGHMSRDAHKMIVKKAVDKVLSTFQPHQIPSTAESVKSYLSASESKLAKLVEGYINKYGKC